MSADVGPMHIAIVIERFAPQAGGNEKSTAQIAQALAQRGHHVTVLCASGAEDHGVPGIEVQRFAKGASSSVLRLVRFSRWARQRLLDGGFGVSLSMTMAVPATVMQPRGGTVRETLLCNVAMRETPLSRWAKQAALWLSPKQQVLLLLERKTVADPRVQRFVAISGYVVDQLRRHFGIDEDRIDVIPNASVMAAPSDEQRTQWRAMVRRELGVAEDAPLFLFAAQNPRLKGMSTLMRALRILADQGVAPVVMLAGGFGYAQQDWAAAVGLREHVRFVGQCRDMAVLYAAADATVLPTFYDPASKVVIESLMAGTPAVSTAYNGASDFIAPPDSAGDPAGLVIDDPADAASLADAMARVVEPDAHARFAAATAGLAEQLSMDRHVEALEHTLAVAADALPAPRPEASPEVSPEAPPEASPEPLPAESPEADAEPPDRP